MTEGRNSQDALWAAHRAEQRSAISSGTTPAQRLAWLEEAIRFAARAGVLPRRSDGEKS